MKRANTVFGLLRRTISLYWGKMSLPWRLAAAAMLVAGGLSAATWATCLTSSSCASSSDCPYSSGERPPCQR